MTKTRTCGKCEKEYEAYMALIPDNIIDYIQWIEMKEEYDWFCQDCFIKENPNTNIVFSVI